MKFYINIKVVRSRREHGITIHIKERKKGIVILDSFISNPNLLAQCEYALRFVTYAGEKHNGG